MSASTIARIKILLGALLFSTGGVAIKATTLTGWQVAGLRCLVAAVFMLLFIDKARRGWSWRTVLVAVPYATTFILYTLANKTTTAANAIFLQDTAPLYLLLLGPLLLGERIRRSDLFFLAALAVGLLLIFFSTAPPLDTAPAPDVGNVLAAAAGVSWALTILGLRWIAVRGAHTDEQPLAGVVAGCLLAFLVAAPFGWPLHAPTMVDWMIVVHLGVFQIGLAYVLITEGVRSVSALESSLLLLIEPVFVPLWAWLLLEETTSAMAFAGGMLIIAATVLNTVKAGAANVREARSL